MSEPPPAFYNDLNRSLERGWDLIAEGVTNRDSQCHTPVVATVGADGRPAQRVLVLREYDRENHILRFHTDARSDKISEIAEQPRCSVLLYDTAAKIQLRLGGMVRIETKGALSEQAWLDADNYARRCYLAMPGPGTPAEAPTSGLPAQLEGAKPSDAQLEPARSNFAILMVRVEIVDFLYLAHQGHRRARFERTADRWTGQWLVP